MDSPIVINLVYPLSFLGVLGVIFIYIIFFFISFFDAIFCANRIAPDGTPRSVALRLGLYYLPMSHKNGTPGLYELIKHAINCVPDLAPQNVALMRNDSELKLHIIKKIGPT